MTATDGAAEQGSANRRLVARGLLALPAVLVLVATVAPPLAQGSETSGYGQKAPTPKTEPKKGAEPAKATTTPKAATSPAASTPAATAASPKASTLPFTGLNLTWVLSAGLLLLAAGLAIRLAQRPRPGG
jgi:hypothetical protein